MKYYAWHYNCIYSETTLSKRYLIFNIVFPQEDISTN